jgi:hypothetical protein
MKIKIALYKLCQWTFTMEDMPPGPSTGDAEEYIESLGCNPGSFFSLDLVSDTLQDTQCVSEFSVSGSLELVNRLRELHDAGKKTVSAPPRLVSNTPRLLY